MNLIIFKSKGIDNIYMPDEMYFKEYAAKLAKESSQELLKKSTVNNITPTTIIIKKNTLINNTTNHILRTKDK